MAPMVSSPASTPRVVVAAGLAPVTTLWNWDVVETTAPVNSRVVVGPSVVIGDATVRGEDPDSRIEALETKVARLNAELDELRRVEVRVVREVSQDEAVEMVEATLRTAGEDLYPSDIAERLDLPYQAVVDALVQLSARGVVAPCSVR